MERRPGQGRGGGGGAQGNWSIKHVWWKGGGGQVTECDTRRVSGVGSGILRMRLQTCPE